MKREDIEKAALLFAGAGEFGECPYNPDAKNGFMAGANWRINSVWHDASEEVENKPALIEYPHRDGSYGYLVVLNPQEVKEAITRLAYIEDLIPYTEE